MGNISLDNFLISKGLFKDSNDTLDSITIISIIESVEEEYDILFGPDDFSNPNLKEPVHLYNLIVEKTSK